MVRRTLIAALLATLGATPAALAHGPTPQKASRSIEIAAPPANVWATIQDFGDIAAWHPLVAESAGDGAGRKLTLKPGTSFKGGALEESLDEHDPAKTTYSWRSGRENVEAFPVSSYSSTLTVSAVSGGSEVSWTSRFYRGDTGNEPRAGLDDGAAVAAMTELVGVGLDAIKAQAEAESQ